MSTIGYTGFLAGPSLIGVVAEHTTLAWGLGLVAVLAAVAAVLALGLRSAERAATVASACRPDGLSRRRPSSTAGCAHD